MTQQVINVGTTAGDGTGDPGRTAFLIVNSNFAELYLRAPTGDVFSSVTYAASVTLAQQSNNRIIMTGDMTVNLQSSPTPSDGALVYLWATASGAIRNVSLNAAIKIPTGSTFSGAQAVASGGKARFVFQYDATRTVWELIQFINGY